MEYTHLLCVNAAGPWLPKALSFFNYVLPIIKFKGVLMKLKIVALAISVILLIFTIFLDVLLLSNINLARVIFPCAAG